MLRIWLRSLDAASANALLDNLLGTAADLDALKARILRHTGQIPLFIEEVARQLIDRRAARRLREASWDTLEIPPTVQGVIASRIDRLSKEDKALLQLASVLGPRISPHLLAAVTEMPTAQLQSRLWSLEILDFLEEARSVPSVEYVFAHDLIREVAYEFDPPLAAGGAAPPDFDGSGSNLDRARRRRCRSALPSCGQGAGLEQGGPVWAFGGEEGVCQIGVPGRYRNISRSRWMRWTSSRNRRRVSNGRSICASKRDWRLCRLESIERMVRPCVAMRRRGPRKFGDEGRRLASIAIRAAALNFYGTPYEAIAVAEEAVALANQMNNDALAWLCRIWPWPILFSRRTISGCRAASRKGDCAAYERTGKRPAGNDGIKPSGALPHDERHRSCMVGRI